MCLLLIVVICQVRVPPIFFSPKWCRETQQVEEHCNMASRLGHDFPNNNTRLGAYPFVIAKPGNTEQGKCLLTNEYLFFLFFIGHFYYENSILSL